MRETDPLLKQAVLKVVDNQIKGLEPPETKQTCERLKSRGHSDADARRLIGCVVAAEIFDVLKQNQPFNRDRFVRALDNLPKLPFEE